MLRDPPFAVALPFRKRIDDGAIGTYSRNKSIGEPYLWPAFKAPQRIRQPVRKPDIVRIQQCKKLTRRVTNCSIAGRRQPGVRLVDIEQLVPQPLAVERNNLGCIV